MNVNRVNLVLVTRLALHLHMCGLYFVNKKLNLANFFRGGGGSQFLLEFSLLLGITSDFYSILHFVVPGII